MALTGLVAANNLSDVVDIERTWDNIGDNISATVFVPAATLDLNFAGNKSLVDNISGSGLVTFTRASSGTFVGSDGLIQNAASGVPRFDHNPATGESLGLLVEEARTNSQLYSEQFDNNTTWSKFNSSVTANAVIAPDGTLTADKLINDSSTNAHLAAGINVSVASLGTGGTFSCFMKAAELTRAALGYDDVYVVFNLSTGAVFSTTNVPGFTVTSSIQSFPNGWYRCSITVNTGGAAFNRRTSVWTANNSGNISYAGDGASGVYTWGAQFEQGLFPTSYIPTTTIPLLRSADVVSIAGSNFSRWWNNGAGSIYANYKFNPGGRNNFSVILGTGANGNNRFMLRVGTSPVLQAEKGIVAWSDFRYGIAPVNLRAYGNGAPGEYYTNYQDVTPIYPENLYIGSQFYSYWMNGTISRVTYYPVNLSNITLQTLTTLGPVSSFPYSFSIKGRDILALKEVNKTSTRDFVFIKGLLSRVQPRINTASQYTASGVALRNAAMLKVAPTTAGNYFFSSGLTLSGTTVQINGTNALSIGTSPFTGSGATVPLLFAGLRPQANWRITEPMTSGTVASPESAIPIETSDFLLFVKAGQS